MSGDSAALRRRVAVGLFVTVLAVAAVLLATALAPTWRFIPDAPSSFWAISLLALVAEAPVFARRGTRATLSVSFTFTIFLQWGAGPAIVVQALATVVRALSQRLPVWQAAFLCGRLVCALGAAQLVSSMIWPREPAARALGPSLLAYLLPVLAWFVVSYGLLVVGFVAVGLTGVHSAATALREDILGTAALLLLLPQVLAVQPGWWSTLVLVPLLAWNQLSRVTAGREETLRRDPATGVLNRRGLMAAFDHLAVAGAVHPSGGRPFGLVLVQVEPLPDVSRNLGPEIAEELARLQARRLASVFSADLVGRFSTEAFVALVPGLDGDRAVEEGRRISALLSAPVEVDGIPFVLEATAGIVLSPAHGRDFETLTFRAQLAAATASRPDERVKIYRPEAAERVRRRQQLLTELHATLRDPDRHAWLAVLYQPQVDIATGRLVGVEALVRWTHPELGTVRVDELIAAIETSEVMHLLTAHVLDRAVAQASTWHAQGLSIPVAVNISLLDLYHQGFVDLVAGTLRRHNLPPSRLTIEITEGAVTSDISRVVRAARAVSTVGVGMSLDDFGTGFASLQQLRQLPLTEIKVDKSYVSQMTDRTVECSLVKSLHQFAAALGLHLVAEGVEDEQTVGVLRELPGIVGQGYYFGEPMTAAELDDWRRARELSTHHEGRRAGG